SGSGKGYDIHQIDLVPISSDGSDYLLDGGDGTDFVFAQKGSRVKNDDGLDDVVDVKDTPAK
ncbi:MAG: hypothetical protein V2A66_02070, partial [Pseudomonadota bacterium]